MIIIQMIGGMGNQMFQYALFYNLYNRYEDVYYETFYSQPHHNGFELDKVYNIIEKPITDITLLNKLSLFQETTWPKFNPEILNKKNTYLCGNWQNIEYFPNEELLRKHFIFKQELDDKNKKILKDIKDSNSVSIHVRKTDYNKYIGYFFQADWMNYYGLAVDQIIKNTKERPLNFFVFSDDIEWCKKNILIPAIFVENKGNDSWKDMLLMSNCKHNITTNSTFSWWAAWFNKNPNKIVITPKRWFLDNTDSNLITLNDWIKI